MNKHITEDYVSFEIAKLLKEKGFDIPTHAFYNPKKSYILKIDTCLINRNAGIYVSAPTHQMALKWLREVHNIFIEISVDDLLAEKGYQWALFFNESKSIRPYAGWGDTYEQTVEAAILYVLKNLM